MKEIQLTRGYVAIVDDGDFEELSKHKWYADVSRSTVYAARGFTNEDGKTTTLRMHRQIVSETNPRVFVDHRDGNGLNNTRDNLRRCSNAQNLLNRGSDRGSASKFKGVYWHKYAKRWTTRIKVDGKMMHLGLFDNEEDAARQFNQFARDHHGEFANYNDVTPLFPCREWVPKVITLKNKSGFRGVSFNNNLRVWIAQIVCKRKHTFIGRFSDPKDAAKAYDKKAFELLGESARLNFPNTIKI